MSACEETGICSQSAPTLVAPGADGRPELVGSGRSVEDVVDALGRCGSVAGAARTLGLTPHQVRVAVEYWERFPE